MEEIKNGDSKMCRCGKHKGHKEWGWVLILFGLLFLAGAMEWIPQDFVNVTWHILLIILGIKKLCMKHKCMCANK